MSITKRNEHLQEFFSDDTLKLLDEAEKTILYEEFANSELRLIATQPIETIHARLSRHLQAETKRRLSQIQPEEYELLKPWYLENCHTVDEIRCTKCGVLLGLEVDTIDDDMNPYHHEGKFVIAVGDKLMAYKPRLDGIMGYQCGNIIENEAAKKDWEKFDADIKKASEIYDEQMIEYKKELENYEKLSEKTRAKRPYPVIPSPIVYSPPTEPRVIECGNNTLWGQIELDNIPESHVMTSVTKEDRIKVKQEMNATNYVPDVKETKHGKTVETFELRKVK